jgi:transcriptional regulator with XRE-family HTH domain
MVNSKEYRRDFVSRTRIARVTAGFSQAQIASLLGVDANSYSKYEAVEGQQSMLPNHLVEVFCIACKVSEHWLFTGKGSGPAVAPPTRAPRVALSRSGKARSS